MKRRTVLAGGVGLAVLGVGGAVGLRAWALARAETLLAARGITWSQARTGATWAEWRGLQGPGVKAASLHAQALPRPRATLVDVDVDVERLWEAMAAQGGERGGAAAGGVPRVRVEVEGLRLRWRGEVLAEGMNGQLSPVVALRGEGVEVSREAGAWQARLDRAVDIGPLTAHGQLELAERGDGITAVFSAADAVLDHPLLAAAPLPPNPLRVQVHYKPATDQLDAELRLGDVQASLTGRFDLDDRSHDLHLSADDVRLADVIALFGPRIPEAGRANCEGTLGIAVDLEGPPLRWEAWPRAEGLRCTGLLTDVDALQRGAVTWKARGPEGEPTVKRTGPGEKLWTPWPEGRRVAEAMMAAEDIAFPSHPGFDLSAIKEVLDEAATEDGRLRGGSTMTQQLAKNLYLDGNERTLARKLRELMYALDLEASLDKRHILQLYINIVELGPDLHGVGPASNTYFAKRPGGLTDREAAFLASLLPSPTDGYTRAMAGRPSHTRIDGILDNLGLAGLRTPDQVRKAKAERLVILPPPTH